MHNYNDTQIIIMAGGVGSRFWPMSTPDYPKQFIDVMGVGRSLIQLTVDRLKPICPIENMWVVTNEKYISIVKEQIPNMPVDNILAEPEARNTAPCIAYACWKIQKKHPAANIVVTPSDALVINTTEYQRVLSKALSYTSDKNAIVTIGIKPSRPETGYGYIAAAEPTSVDEIYKVEAFKEKPNLETAEQYLAAGNYYWNAGIFVWNIDTISKAIRTFQPNLASIMDEMAPSFYTEQEKEVVGKLFPTCEKISIDYAVMEKSKEIYTLPAEFGWSDLGSWGSLRTLLPQDEAGNAKVGKDILLYECKNCVVHAADERKVVVQGLDGYIAAAEPTSVDEIYKVEAFKEKPNLETAEQYLAAGNYYWNAGIFVWNIDTISKAIRIFQPNLASIMDEMAPSFYTEQEKEVVGKLFPTCEKISIDYAVMEK